MMGFDSYYDRQGNPITYQQWIDVRSHGQDAWEAARRVDVTTIGDARVSTVWLGLDHSFGYGPPVIFETMIFGGEHDQWQNRYCTEEEALAGHQAVVDALTNGTPLPYENDHERHG